MAVTDDIEDPSEHPERYAAFLVRSKPGNASSTTRTGPTTTTPTTTTPTTTTARVKQAESTSYLTSDRGSGAKRDLSLWTINCPDGYDALGVHATEDHSDIADSSGLACFDRNITFQLEPLTDPAKGEPKGALWTTKNTKSQTEDWGVYGVKRGKDTRFNEKNSVLVPPPTFWAKARDYGPPELSKFRGLKLQITPPKLHSSSGVRPQLTQPSVEGWDDSKQAITTEGYTVSALAVSDPFYTSDLARLIQSPNYYVYRTTTWMPVDKGLRCDAASVSECQYEYTKMRTESEAQTWNNTVGITLSQSAEIEASGKPLGVGVSTKFSLGIEESYSHDFGGSSQSGSEEGVSKSFSITPPAFGVAFQAESTYAVYRKGDESRSEVNKVKEHKAFEQGALAFETYSLAPPKSTTCDDRDVECGLPATRIDSLPTNKALRSSSGNHYLILTKQGTLEVRNAKQGLRQHKFVWSLDTVHPQFGKAAPISSVTFRDGRLQVLGTRSTGDLTRWASFADEAPGAMLDIDEEGNLQIVETQGDGTIPLWNSASDDGEVDG